MDPGVLVAVIIVVGVIAVFAYLNRACCCPPAVPPNQGQYQQQYY